MTTNATHLSGGNRNTQLEQASALKVLIGSASLALTLAGWGWLSHQQAMLNNTASAAPAEQPGVSAQTMVENVAPATAQPLPTLAPLRASNSATAGLPAQMSNAAPQVVMPQVAAPQPQLRAVTAPPRPVAVTRSSR